jgi:hypothetical protein
MAEEESEVFFPLSFLDAGEEEPECVDFSVSDRALVVLVVVLVTGIST